MSTAPVSLADSTALALGLLHARLILASSPALSYGLDLLQLATNVLLPF